MSIDSLTTPALLAAQPGPTEADLRGKSLDAAAIEFESYLVEMMVREMRATVPEGMFQNSAAELFGGVLDQEISKRIAEAGGMGFARLLTANHGPSTDGSSASRSVRMVPNGSMGQGIESMGLGWESTAELPVDGVVTSRFGQRTDPFHGRQRAHKGMDIAAPKGSPIQPVRAGTVVSAGRRGSYGKVVVVDHGEGMTSLYAHCDELRVRPGDQVGANDVIATVGNTGRSTGPHLHLEIHKDGSAVDPAIALGWNGNHGTSITRHD